VTDVDQGAGREDDYPLVVEDTPLEVAIRVRITPEVVEAARAGWLSATGGWTVDPRPREVARLKAAFEAAGIEVVE
jgi:hypothetical protein